MGHRTVKRVPLDFDAPLNEVWEGYRMQAELQPDACRVCHDRDGLTPEARAISDTFYAHNIASSWDRRELNRAQALAWGDKIGQAEVDHLLAEGRLRTYVQVPEDQRCGEPCEGEGVPDGAVWRGDPCGRFAGHDGGHHPRAGEWQALPRTAAQVNAEQRVGGLSGHDGINKWILVRFRCERLGIEMACPGCDGHGETFPSPEAEAEYEAWSPMEPPVGDGWQLWETTSEGSPVSPVFETAELLAAWCETEATAFASIKWTAAQWLETFVTDTTDIGTLLVTTGDGRRVQP